MEVYGDCELRTLGSTFGVSVTEVIKKLLVIRVGNVSVNLLKESTLFIVKAGRAVFVLKILLEAISL
uniref:Ferrous iron transport protein A n=1 Tax=Strongyloides venezuelensis TaxID=75913 RepID=A0A0K0F3D7_STRVS